ncbi:MAG: hypothetical protein R6U66_11150 [Bacteroidales bacterium]
MQLKKVITYIFMPIMVAAALLMVAYLIWWQKNEQPLSVYVLDKTVPTNDYFEHKPFFWVLHHNKIVKENGTLYRPDEDYYGFVPLNKDDKHFEIRTLGIDALEATANAYDMCYFTDTYGVYYNHWYQQNNVQAKGSGKVYGGLNNNDYLLLKAFKEQRKLILAEYNLYNGPTPNLVRSKVEQLLGLQWSGWTGKYFAHLDTLRKTTLPGWIVSRYKSQNGGEWPFSGSGVVLVHKYGKILVLDYPEGEGQPMLITDSQQAAKYKVPVKLPFERWFDISQVTDTTHKVLANFQLQPSHRDSILSPMQVPTTFPAIIHQSDNYLFYYFAGDFAEMHLPMGTARLAGSAYLHKFFSGNAKQFMWDYYYPIMDNILNEYVNNRSYEQ